MLDDHHVAPLNLWVDRMLLHAYCLIDPDSPHAPEMCWEWMRPHMHSLLRHAKLFHRQVTQQYFTWDALMQENQRIWTVPYVPRPCYQPWETWQAWLEESRAIVRDVEERA